MDVNKKIIELQEIADRHVVMTNEVVTVQDILKNHPKKTPILLDILKRAKKSR